MSEGDPQPLDRRSLSEEKERLRAIEEVVRDQARREVLRDIAYRRPRASFRTRIAAAVLGLIAFITWVLPMPWLQPAIPFPILPDEEIAGLRLATYVQAQQVEAFRRTSGRLPDLLRETGEPIPGMIYERLDARTYRLSGTTERSSIRWVSTDSLSALLADSAQRLPGLEQ